VIYFRAEDGEMTHDDVWGAIEQFASEQKLTCSGLARKGGLDPTTFNRSKRWSRDGQPRWPSTHSIAKILAATGKSIDDFVRYLGQNPQRD
jgi:phage repressor protein C with HTH and peptisase S24 domain